MIRQVETFGEILEIEQDLRIVNKEAGAIIWDCTFVLLKSFENLSKYPSGFFQGKKILELGSGTGILGIVLARMGAQVVLTDRSVLLPLMQLNVDRNCTDDIRRNCRVEELNWGETPIIESFDHVVICDCVYESREMWLPLAKCLQMIADINPNVDIILAYELRSNKDAAFFPYISQFFDIQPIPDDDYHPEWTTPEIRIFNLKKLTDQMEISQRMNKPLELSDILVASPSNGETQAAGGETDDGK